jgi:hypothetical protein
LNRVACSNRSPRHRSNRQRTNRPTPHSRDSLEGDWRPGRGPRSVGLRVGAAVSHSRGDDRHRVVVCSSPQSPSLAGPRQARNLAKVGVEGSNPFARSSQTPAKHSLLKFPPRKRPGSGRFCASDLGFVGRIYSTSFLALSIKAFTIYTGCKV